MLKGLFLGIVAPVLVYSQTKVTGTSNSQFPSGFNLPSSIKITNNSTTNTTGQISYPVCKSLWSVEGTICNGSRLSSFQKNTTNQSNADINKTEVALQELNKTASTSLVEAAAARSLARSLQLLDPNPDFNSLLFPSDYSEFQDSSLIVNSIYKDRPMNLSLAFFDELIVATTPFTSKKLLNDFKIQTNSCAVQIEKARSAASCYICSKQNSKYFYNMKAIITEQDCGIIMAACFKFFDLAIGLIKIADEFVASIGPKRILPSKLTYAVRNLSISLNHSNITSLLITYKTETNAAKKQAAANQICVRLVRLYLDPVYLSIKNVSAEIDTDLKQVVGARRLLQAAVTSTSASSTTSTVSSTATGTASDYNYDESKNPFVGDVAVNQPGNTLIYFNGYSSTSHNYQSGEYYSMNLSIIFAS